MLPGDVVHPLVPWLSERQLKNGRLLVLSAQLYRCGGEWLSVICNSREDFI